MLDQGWRVGLFGVKKNFSQEMTKKEQAEAKGTHNPADSHKPHKGTQWYDV